MAANDMTEVMLHKHHETSGAYLFSDDGERKKAVWVPKSQCGEITPTRDSNIFQVEMPEWLATDKGFI